jgi:hypothetical protein
MKEALNRPESIAKRSAIGKIVQNKLEVKARRAAAYMRPEVKAKLGQSRDMYWANDGKENRRLRNGVPLQIGWRLGRAQ